MDLLRASIFVTLRHPDCMDMIAIGPSRRGPRTQRYLVQAGGPLDFSLNQQGHPQ